MIKELSVKTTERNQMVDITSEVEQHLKNIQEETITLHVPHTTAAVTINEGADPDVQKDILSKLAKLIPERDNYGHAEGNSDAHIKSSLIGCTTNLIVKEEKLLLGTWQRIFFCEFDGPRQRKILLKI